MDMKEIQKLIKLAKKSGLIHVKVGDVELNFTPDSIKKTAKAGSNDEIKDKQEDPMKALFWSVPDLDPLSKAQ